MEKYYLTDCMDCHRTFTSQQEGVRLCPYCETRNITTDTVRMTENKALKGFDEMLQPIYLEDESVRLLREDNLKYQQEIVQLEYKSKKLLKKYKYWKTQAKTLRKGMQQIKFDNYIEDHIAKEYATKFLDEYYLNELKAVKN